MQAIREHGVCIEHRKSFAPIRWVMVGHGGSWWVMVGPAPLVAVVAARQALEKQSDISVRRPKEKTVMNAVMQ